ncbi:MAG: restriction endonuclease subunit S [Bacteroidales bacterium]|nr:restriction endonuclease subunit S [Bacteroidales bacterium]MEE1253122.1 restriction endonuclease subunit S [Bacteroidales bacterium]
MSEWKEYKLEDLTIDGKGSYGIAASAIEFDASKYTYLRITDINDDGTINKNGLKSVDDVNASNYLLRPNDIVFARTGASVGRSYFYDGKDGEFVYAGFLIKFSIDPNKVNPKILKYYTHSQPYYDWILSVDNGATRGNINAQTYSSMPIILPDRNRQDKIVSILSSLDDKIDLLHRENKTLEAMAETLFRQWFIEEAKEDWKEVPLTKIANFLNGLPCQKYPPKNNIEKLPVLKIRELSNGIGKDCDWATTDIANEYIVSNGDVIFAWSASLMVKIWNGENCILNQHLFKVTSDKYPKWFYYFWCKYHLDEFITIAQSHATTMGHIKRKDLDSAIILLPTDIELEIMNSKIENIFEKIENNNNEIQTLIQTRDSLLPKLMSGEIKV